MIIFSATNPSGGRYTHMRYLTQLVSRLAAFWSAPLPPNASLQTLPLHQPERRGNLALNRDRAQHRRYHARYEDLLN